MLEPVEWLVGTTIGDYDLLQLLGKGKLSAVYAARQAGKMEQVMLTVFLLPPECQGIVRERFIARFIEHASALSLLRHPHIVPTNDFGEQDGYPYLVTPIIEGETIASLLKKQQRCSPDLMLTLLRQIAAALDYAHAHNIIHGTLKASNVLLVRKEGSDGSYAVMTAGFGLAHMLEIRGIGQVAHQYPGLFSIAGTLLTNPIYIAPEVVQGEPFDERADVYALGILAFEMLCGQPPFTGANPFDVLQKHVHDRIPALQTLAPDVAAALDIALQLALERDPGLRLQSAGKLVIAFERVLNVMDEAAKPAPLYSGATLPTNIHLALLDTLPPDENNIAIPGITSAHIPSVFPSFPINTNFRLQNMLKTNLIAVETSTHTQLPENGNSKNVPLDAAMFHEKSHKNALPWTQSTINNSNNSTHVAAPHKTVKTRRHSNQRSSQPDQGRRRIIKAVNGSITVGILVGGGFSLWHLLQGEKAGQANTNEIHSQSTPSVSNHDNTLISTTIPDSNTAQNFTNPLTDKLGILIRLPDNSLVAYDRACTHEGVAVNYDPKSHTLICPKHQAQFDPAKHGAVLKGPAMKSLSQVAIQVSSDGKVSMLE